MINIKAEDVNQAKLAPNAAEELTKTEVLIHRLMTETCVFKATALWGSLLHSNRLLVLTHFCLQLFDDILSLPKVQYSAISYETVASSYLCSISSWHFLLVDVACNLCIPSCFRYATYSGLYYSLISFTSPLHLSNSYSFRFPLKCHI